MVVISDGIHVRLRSRSYLHGDEGGRGVSLPRRARRSLATPWPAHRLLRYVTAWARLDPLVPGRRVSHLLDAAASDGDYQDAILRLGSCALCHTNGEDYGGRVFLEAIPRPAPQLLPLGIEVDWQCFLKAQRPENNNNDLTTIFSCEQPIWPLIREKSWEAYMGFPMEQTVPDTCTLVACTVCVEATHRLEYETWHGPGTFPCRAAAPRKLRRACFKDNIWTHKHGANVNSVLKKMKEMGGVKTTNAAAPALFLLPLRSWQGYDEPTLECVVHLLDRGPCIGSVLACPWWPLFDASINDKLVYRGCGRNKGAMTASVLKFGWDEVGRHAVVCYKYRLYGKEEEEEEEGEEAKGEAEAKVLHVLVMDNDDATRPPRWIDYKELLNIYSVDVDRVEPPLHLGGRRLTYPRSGC